MQADREGDQDHSLASRHRTIGPEGEAEGPDSRDHRHGGLTRHPHLHGDDEQRHTEAGRQQEHGRADHAPQRDPRHVMRAEGQQTGGDD